MKQAKKIFKKVREMELNNPIIHVLLGLIIFYVGLKMFAGGMKSQGDNEQTEFFTAKP